MSSAEFIDFLQVAFENPSANSIDGSIHFIFFERHWRSLKQEAVYLHELHGGFKAKCVIDNWIEFYNNDRPRTALEKGTPNEAYFQPASMKQAHEAQPKCTLAKS